MLASYISINLEGIVNLKTYTYKDNCKGHLTYMKTQKMYRYIPVWSLCIKFVSCIKQLPFSFSKQEVPAGYQVPISRCMICSHSGPCKKSFVCIWLPLRTLVMSLISTQLTCHCSEGKRHIWLTGEGASTKKMTLN